MKLSDVAKAARLVDDLRVIDADIESVEASTGFIVTGVGRTIVFDVGDESEVELLKGDILNRLKARRSRKLDELSDIGVYDI